MAKILLLVSGSLFALWFSQLFWLSLCYRKKYTAVTKGVLQGGFGQKNVLHGGAVVRVRRDWVHYAYQYEVNGKKYTLSGQRAGKMKSLPAKIKVIYQVRHPKYAYSPGMTSPREPLLAVVVWIFAAAFLLVGFSLP